MLCSNARCGRAAGSKSRSGHEKRHGLHPFEAGNGLHLRHSTAPSSINSSSGSSSSELSPLEELKPTKSGNELELLVRLWLAEPQYTVCGSNGAVTSSVEVLVLNKSGNRLRWR